MQRRPNKRFSSLRQRLDRAGLVVLRIARHPVQPHREPASARQLPPWVSLRTLVLAVLLSGAALRLGISVAPWLNVAPTAPSHRREPRGAVPVAHRSPTGLGTAQNIEDLAQILMSEASPEVANQAESAAVAATVLNRMEALGTHTVRDVWDGYAHHATPTDEVRTLAAQVLRGDIPDVSGGATHFYSPRSMPMEGDALGGFDTSGGLEQTAGLLRQNYRPGWAAQFDAVAVVGTRESHYKFYRQPDEVVSP